MEKIGKVHLNGAPFLFGMNHTGGSGIKFWAEEDRPREKMLLKGKAALSDAELIAILLGSGTRKLTAVELARQLLALAGNNLVQLGQLPIENLMQLNGIGEAKAITIAAALELGRRRQKANAHERIHLNRSDIAYQLLAPILADLPHEEFWIIMLNQKYEVLNYKSVSSGGMTGTIADIRMIFKLALTEKATNIILAHNHPSGNLEPSNQDIKLTKKICEAGALMDIRVADHIIVTDRGYFSFADKDMIS